MSHSQARVTRTQSPFAHDPIPDPAHASSDPSAPPRFGNGLRASSTGGESKMFRWACGRAGRGKNL